MDFTCILSLLPGGLGDLLWLGTLSVTLLLYCVVLWESLLVPPSLARGEQSQLLWLLETVWCSYLLMPPPWSAAEADSASVAAGVCGIGIAGCKQGENAAYIFICPWPCRFVLEPLCP